MPAANATLHNPELGIADVPDACSALIMGATYGLVVDNPPARYPLMSSLIRDTWQKGLPTTLITPADPASLIQRLSALDFSSLPPALERNEVRLLQTQGDIAKKMFRFGGSRLVRELRYFGVPENSLLIFDQADDLFSLHDLSLALSQIEAVKTWATAANVAVLLMFSGITLSSTYQSTLSGMLDQLAGMARIETDGEVLSFSLEFWKSVGGAVTHQRFELDTLPTGVYRVARHQAKTTVPASPGPLLPPGSVTPARAMDAPSPALATYTIEPAGHQRTFFYESPRLERLKRSIDGEWHRVDGLAGLLRASRSVTVPYILLRYGADTDLRSLAEMVNVLRSSLDALAKIIVVEDDASLRYRNEVLLLRLGASLVIQRDTPDIRVPLLMESLVGQVFRGDRAIDFDAALSSVLDVPHKGYLAPALFVSEVAAGMERSAILNTPAALVSIKVEPDASAFDLLRSSTFTRTGDLATASPWEILLFLPGCPEAFVARILASTFPSHALFVPRWDVFTETHREGIRTQIHRFAALIPSDYSDLSGHLVSDQAPSLHASGAWATPPMSRPEPPTQVAINTRGEAPPAISEESAPLSEGVVDHNDDPRKSLEQDLPPSDAPQAELAHGAPPVIPLVMDSLPLEMPAPELPVGLTPTRQDAEHHTSTTASAESIPTDAPESTHPPVLALPVQAASTRDHMGTTAVPLDHNDLAAQPDPQTPASPASPAQADASLWPALLPDNAQHPPEPVLRSLADEQHTITTRPRAVRVSEIQRTPAQRLRTDQTAATRTTVASKGTQLQPYAGRRPASGNRKATGQLGLFAAPIGPKSAPSPIAQRGRAIAPSAHNIMGNSPKKAAISPASSAVPAAPSPVVAAPGSGRATRVTSESIHEHRSQILRKNGAGFLADTPVSHFITRSSIR